jgi:putative transposase
MHSLDEIINESGDVREVKRALSVKMGQEGLSSSSISSLLNVSVQYVSKWKVVYERAGAAGLRLGYEGRDSYLSEEQRQAIVGWIQGQETLNVEEVRDYIERHYGVVYQSKQSYYALMEAGGMSYHRSQKDNPKQDEAQVLARREEIKKNWHHTLKPSVTEK